MKRAWCCAAICSLVSAEAAAQGFALNRFDPAPAGDPFFGVSGAATGDRRGLGAAVGADYAHAPLMLRTAPGGRELGAVVAGQLTLRMGISLALARRALASVDLPVAVVNEGDSPASPDGTRLASPGGAALGDARARLRVRVAGDDGLALAVAGSLWLPTGSRARYTGDGHLRPGAMLLASGQGSRLLWAAGVGIDRRLLVEPARTAMTTVLTGAAAAGVLLRDGRVLVGPELSAAAAPASRADRATNLEALLGVHLRGRTVDLGLGAGPGLSVGMGTPDVRVVATAGYAGRAPAAAAPPPPGDPFDGVVPRAAARAPAADRPFAPVPDPDESSPPRPPPAVHVTQTAIVIEEHIPFEVASARLAPEVLPRLERVARVMRDNVEIQRLAIESYTDARESPAASFELARQRADAVRDWLVAQGIEARRLVTRPLGRAGAAASNATEQGRALNRRVEFRIVPAVGLVESAGWEGRRP